MIKDCGPALTVAGTGATRCSATNWLSAKAYRLTAHSCRTISARAHAADARTKRLKKIVVLDEKGRKPNWCNVTRNRSARKRFVIRITPASAPKTQLKAA